MNRNRIWQGRFWNRTGDSMNIDGWRYYNHAAVPKCAPHEKPNLKPIEDGSIWKMDGKPFFATWTEDYDCEEATEWWYCILDKPFDISAIKAGRRYKINKGNKLFEVKEIEPLEYKSELLKVQIAAFSAYPEKYRPVVNEDEFYLSLEKYSEEIKKNECIFYGAFYRETGELCGYHTVNIESGVSNCNVFKSNPEYEKYQINAALVYKWVSDAEDLINSGGYCANGTRSINHETAFQDYLEYYFGFRKAYCKLRMKYNPLVKPLIAIARAFKLLLVKRDDIGLVHKVNAMLKMDEISKLSGKERDNNRFYELYVCPGGPKEHEEKESEWNIVRKRITIGDHGIKAALFWNIISLGRCKAYRVLSENGELIHESLVIRKCYKFPFLKGRDIEIGPCKTNPEWRGKGIYPAVLRYILSTEISDAGIAYMIIDKNNNASIRGVEKAGFRRERKVRKTKILKVYKKMLI